MTILKKTSFKFTLAALAALAMGAEVSLAQSHFGRFPLGEEEEKKPKKVVKQDIVDVRSDGPGPRSLREALKLVEENGRIFIHPGNYAPDDVTIVKSVNIVGVPSTFGVSQGRTKLPVLRGQGSGCIRLARDTLQVRISNVAFQAAGDSCINVMGGVLDFSNGAIYGVGYRQDVFINPNQRPEGRQFSQAAIDLASSGLVTVRSGQVSLNGNTIVGGQTGVLVKTPRDNTVPGAVEIRGNQITRASLSGILMDGTLQGVIANNTVAQNKMTGIVVQGSGYAELLNNVVVNNHVTGVYLRTVNDYVNVAGNQFAGNGLEGGPSQMASDIAVSNGTVLLKDNVLPKRRKCAVLASIATRKSKRKPTPDVLGPWQTEVPSVLDYANETTLYKNINTGAKYDGNVCKMSLK